MCLSLNSCCCINLNISTKIIGIFCTLIGVATVLLYGGVVIMMLPELPTGRVLFYAVMAVTGLLELFFGCLLIYGSFASKPKYMWPWIALTWGKSVSLVGLTVAGKVLLVYNTRVETTAEISSVISVYFVYALILFYLASVVNSRRQQLAVEDDRYSAKRMMRYRASAKYYV